MVRRADRSSGGLGVSSVTIQQTSRNDDMSPMADYLSALRSRRGSLPGSFIHVDQRDLRASADEPLRDRVAQPGSAAGDDGPNLIQFHAGSSMLRCRSGFSPTL